MKWPKNKWNDRKIVKHTHEMTENSSSRQMEASIFYQTHQGTTKKLRVRPFSQNNSRFVLFPDVQNQILTPMFFTRSALDPHLDEVAHFRSKRAFGGGPFFCCAKGRAKEAVSSFCWWVLMHLWSLRAQFINGFGAQASFLVIFLRIPNFTYSLV